VKRRFPLPDDGGPPFTHDELERIHDGMALVTRCAFEVASRLRGRVKPRDLLGAGTLALMAAARAFQPSRSDNFDNYAGHHIRGRMLDAFNADRLPLLDRAGYEMDRAAAHFGAQQTYAVHWFNATEAELEEAMDEGCHQLLMATSAAGLLATHHPSAEVLAEEQELYALACEALEIALKELAPDDREVVLRHHRANMSLEAIGQRLGVHVNTVGRRHRRGMRSLRTAMAKRGFTHSPPRVPLDQKRSSPLDTVAANTPLPSADYDLEPSTDSANDASNDGSVESPAQRGQMKK
jgi:RNA polymerase sigma factor (sigma-70 family)